MAYQTVFQRYEIKYMLTKQQTEALLRTMEPWMTPDRYGRSTVRNIYYDTDTFRLARRSLEKPPYKEKLRVRSYERASENSTVFVELKKKASEVVYKRRLAMTEREAMEWLLGEREAPVRSQITDEIAYFRDFYGTLRPAAFLSYDREAFYALDESDFRLTLDENILARRENLTLTAKTGGTPLLREDRTLLELKTTGGLPLWITAFLTRERIYKTSFSKYGAAYRSLIYTHREPVWDGVRASVPEKCTGGRLYA